MTAVTSPERRVTLRRSGGPAIASGSTIAYTVTVDGRWVGWVYDERPWLGSRFGSRAWTWTWREEGDEHARATTNDYGTRAAAVDALAARARGQEDR